MILKLQRKQTITQTTRGRLLINGEVFCDTIENSDQLIPLGFYPVRVTYSPKFDELLPLIDHVIGRSGIRIHPGNTYRDSEGCILVGEMANGLNERDGEEPRLLSSRTTFNTLREQLLQAQHAHEPIYIDIVDASPQHLKQNRIHDRATQRK